MSKKHSGFIKGGIPVPPAEELDGGGKAVAERFGVSLATANKWRTLRGKTKPHPSHHYSTVPMSVFGPVFRHLVDEDIKTSQFDFAVMYSDRSNNDGDLRISERQFRRVYNYEIKNITFVQADRILCLLGKPYLWLVPPLNEFYWEGSPPREKADPKVLLELLGTP